MFLVCFSLVRYFVWCDAGLDLHQMNDISENERLSCLNVSCHFVHLWVPVALGVFANGGLLACLYLCGGYFGKCLFP